MPGTFYYCLDFHLITLINVLLQNYSCVTWIRYDTLRCGTGHNSGRKEEHQYKTGNFR